MAAGRKKREELTEKARKIRLLLLDVDGVMTDGRLYLDDDGRQTRAFHILDGMGIALLRKIGIKVGIITGCSSGAVEVRARQLELDEVHQGVEDKMKVYDEILSRHQLHDSEVAYMGDDIIDRPLLKRVGFSVTVPNAHTRIQDTVHWVTQQPGGHGAVREVADFLLIAQGTRIEDFYG